MAEDIIQAPPFLCYIVKLKSPPEDPSKNYIERFPTLVDGQYTQCWEAVPKTEDELAETLLAVKEKVYENIARWRDEQLHRVVVSNVAVQVRDKDLTFIALTLARVSPEAVFYRDADNKSCLIPLGTLKAAFEEALIYRDKIMIEYVKRRKIVSGCKSVLEVRQIIF